MNIVYVSNEIPSSRRAGGIASYIREISDAMKNRGHSVTIVTASDNTKKYTDYYSNGIRIISLNGGDFFIPGMEKGCKLKKLRALYRFFSYRRKIRKTILSLKGVDVIEVADYGAEGLFLNGINVPVVTRLHTPSLFDRTTEKIARKTWINFSRLNAEKKVLESTDYISSCSKALFDWTSNNLNTHPYCSTTILNPMSVADNIIYQTPFAKQDKVYNIFFAGSIAETKGIGDLLEAINTINREGSYQIHLYIAGKEGAYAASLKERYADKINKEFFFLGKMDRNDLTNYYHYSDICCFPSWWDNMPMVCLEAMSHEGMVIGSDSGGMKEIIEDGVNGFLAHPKSGNGLANIIKKVISLSESKKSEIRTNAKNTIVTKFNKSVIAEQTESFYNKVINDFNNRKQ